VWRAWSFSDAGDFENAAIRMEKALKHMPEDDVNWEKLESYYAVMNQRDKAEKCRNKIQSLRK
jgi:Tfp pilus assembly protein PilF